MPALMRERSQWLLWRLEPNPGKPKPRKVPYYANGRIRHDKQGSAGDRSALVTFEQALVALAAGDWAGLGFAFLPDDGLIGIDIDGAIDPATGEVSARCRAIVEACASYTEYSPSGTGVHIIVQGKTKTFKDNRIGVEVFCERQFFTCTGRRWTGTPSEVAPISEVALRRLKLTVQEARKAALGVTPTPAASGGVAAPSGSLTMWLEQALQVLDSAGCSYDEWIGIGMALRSALGDAGMALWDYWSRKGGERYCGAAKIEAHWKSFAGTDTDGAMVVFRMARRGNRWRPPKAWHDVYGNARGKGAAESAAQPPAEEAPPDGSPPSSGSAGYGGGAGRDWRDDLLRSGSGKKDCRENVFMCLVNHPELKGLLGYDEFAHRVMKLRAPPWDSTPDEWTTNDDYLLGYWLARRERLVLKAEGTIVAGVAMAAFANRYHPVNQYLDSLPAWGGIERLAHWLHECMGAEDSDYSRLVGTWFLMGMVKRVRTPGCQMDYMVVFEGFQGKRKSTALRTIVGNDDWFADTPIRIGDKDSLLSIAGKWLYEFGELDAFNRAETTAVKQYITSRIDRVREPFARRPIDRPRSCVLGGSTNQSEYFKDSTGARRFWPVACDAEINIDKLAQWRDQLFAEALHRLASSDEETRRYWPTREETEKFLVPQQERREITDPWFEKLAIWLDSSQKYGDTMHEVKEVDKFTSVELLTKALNVPMDRIDGNRSMSTRVGTAMHKLGWTKVRDTAPPRLWRYCRPGATAGVVSKADEVLHEF